MAPLLLLLPLLFAGRAASADEPYRPRFHFSPDRNWTNDPNGTVFYRGEYHLFYQYNPFGDTWGHMSWGHAVSRDLIRWEHLPVALAEENGIMIFSGSAVVDEHNSSGFCSKPGGSCLVAIYTGHTQTRQTQNLAYSNDRGRTWTKYASNPVIDPGMKDFRDPKVFWHDPSKRWVMVVALPRDHKVRFYASPDLKQWTALSDFGPAGATGGQWECPDIFPLAIAGERETRWVLSVNLNPGAPQGGSGNQYFAGQFDGATFVNDNPAGVELWADYGKDFYASTSFSGIPARDGRRIWLAWFSNWQYARLEPTSPFRGIQTVPRELALKRTAQGLRLQQLPVRELNRLRRRVVALRDVNVAEANRALAGFHGKSYEVEVDAAADLLVRAGANEQTRVGIDREKKSVFIDRGRSGQTGFHPAFSGAHRAPIDGMDSPLRVLVDASSVEVFADAGVASISDRIFPSEGSDGLRLAGPDQARVRLLRVWRLE